MNENVDIFISAYKDFKLKPTNEVYKIIDGADGEVKNTNLLVYHDNNGDNIAELNKHYNEYSKIYWVWKNYRLKDYIGFCSYRRFFRFFNNVPNIEELFKEYKIVLPSPIKYNKFSVYTAYGIFHNREDILRIGLIIKEMYPDYKDDISEALNGSILYTNGMFIMQKEDFLKFCDFMFSIFKKYDEIMGFKNHKDVIEYVTKNKSKYLKNFGYNKTIDYQSRIHGYLAERMLTIWVHHNFKENEIKTYPISKTEMKYEEEKVNA